MVENFDMVVYECLSSGFDFIKDDENMNFQSFLR